MVHEALVQFLDGILHAREFDDIDILIGIGEVIVEHVGFEFPFNDEGSVAVTLGPYRFTFSIAAEDCVFPLRLRIFQQGCHTHSLKMPGEFEADQFA